VLSRRRLVPAATALVALAFAGAAAADKEKVQLTAADQAKAKATVLRLADLGGPKSGWSGGLAKVSTTTSLECNGYNPKQSDLVVTGRAESSFAHVGLQFNSEVELLKTVRMVKLDWRRSVDQPALVNCLEHVLSKNLSAGERFASFRRLTFPKVGDESAMFRGIVDVKAGAQAVKVMVDVAVIGVGRSEITLITTAPYAAVKDVARAEVHLAQVLASRAVPANTA
jgi:hypothetical protein